MAYDSLGAYVKMGIPQAAIFPEYVQRHDCAIVFGTVPALVVAPEAGQTVDL